MAMWERRKGGFAGRTQTTGGIQMGTTVGTEAAGWYETHRWCCALSAGTTVLEDEGKLLHHQRVGIDDPDPMLTFADCLVSLPHFRFLLDTDSTGEVFFSRENGNPIQSYPIYKNVGKHLQRIIETTRNNIFSTPPQARKVETFTRRPGSKSQPRNHIASRGRPWIRLCYETGRPKFWWIVMNYHELLWFIVV